MEITKEIAYRYLKEKGTMSALDFTVVGIFTEKARIGVISTNEHPVIRCAYNKYGDSSFLASYKNIHISLPEFEDWVRENRENVLNKLLE